MFHESQLGVRQSEYLTQLRLVRVHHRDVKSSDGDCCSETLAGWMSGFEGCVVRVAAVIVLVLGNDSCCCCCCQVLWIDGCSTATILQQIIIDLAHMSSEISPVAVGRPLAQRSLQRHGRPLGDAADDHCEGLRRQSDGAVFQRHVDVGGLLVVPYP